MKWEEFIEACRQKKIECSAVQQNQFVRYAQLLREWNEKINSYCHHGMGGSAGKAFL